MMASRKERKMYEKVKEVNGYAIQRMKGTRGHFRVYIAEGKFVTFRTIKAAAAFAETL